MTQPQTVWRIEQNGDYGLTFHNLLVFSNKRHAIYWGRTAYGDGVVYEIDTRNLRLTRENQDKYRIVGAIPRNNIRRTMDLRDEINILELERNERLQNQNRFRSEPERYPGAYNWFSDEDDALEDIDRKNDFEYALNH